MDENLDIDTSAAMTEENDENGSEASFYELGFHLIPTLGEEDAKAEAAALKAAVAKLGGEVLAEGAAEMFELAYSISKTFKSVKTTYDRSYFGWIKFSLLPSKLAEMKTSLAASENMLRYLLIKIEKQDVDPKPKEVKEKKAKVSMEEVAAIESDLDKTIDQLVIS